MGAKIRTYRLYFLGTRGRIEAVTAIVGDSDDEAVQAAEAVRHGRASELWDGGRLVKAFENSAAE